MDMPLGPRSKFHVNAGLSETLLALLQLLLTKTAFCLALWIHGTLTISLQQTIDLLIPWKKAGVKKFYDVMSTSIHSRSYASLYVHLQAPKDWDRSIPRQTTWQQIASMIYISKNIVLTAMHWTETWRSRLTAKWNIFKRLKSHYTALRKCDTSCQIKSRSHIRNKQDLF
jgi:hypothetical protein